MWALMRRLAAVLTAAPLIVMAGCAQTASRQSLSTPSPTLSTATAPSDATPTPGPFVCAQPAGAHGRYAYVAADGQLTLVNGCDAIEVHGRGSRLLAPQAFSPDGSWLLSSEGVQNPMATPNVSVCDVLINTATGAQTLTPICNPSAADPTRGWFGFIGWSGNTTYYDGGWGVGNDTSVKVYRVSVPGLSVTRVATLAWVGNLANQRTASGMVLRNGAIYYAGYASASDHNHAWLRRYSLASGMDTRIVSLGIAGTGGCQLQVDNTPCLWAGPWDISADGAHIAYHNPGPIQSLSDTNVEQGTPMYIANSDGSAPSRLFLDTGAVAGFLSPYFSPDGAYITTEEATALEFERLASGAVIAAPANFRFPQWTTAPGYVILNDEWDYNLHPVLVNIETGAQVRLQINSRDYVWANAA
jgi:hypothetical protein